MNITSFNNFLTRHQLLIPVLLALANILFRHWWTFDNPYGTADIPSYFYAWEVLLSGRIDGMRTPLYPAILGIVYTLFPAGSAAPAIFILIIQNGLYVFSAYILARIARDGMHLPAWAVIAGCAPYCCMESYAVYASYLQTDSLGATMLVLLAWLVLRCVAKPGLRHVIPVTALMIATIALRPIFLFVPVALILICPFLWSTGRRRATKGLLAAVAVCLAATGSYAVAFYRLSGHFGISAVSSINQAMMNTIAHGIYDGDKYPIHHYFTNWDTDLSPLSWDAVSTIAADNPRAIMDEVDSIYATIPGIRIQATYISISNNVRNRFIGDFLHAYCLPMAVFAYFLILLIYFRRGMRGVRYRLFLWLLVAGNLGVVLLGTPYQYDRLLMPVFPLFYLLVADMALNMVSAGGALLRRGNRGGRACPSASPSRS